MQTKLYTLMLSSILLVGCSALDATTLEKSVRSRQSVVSGDIQILDFKVTGWG